MKMDLPSMDAINTYIVAKQVAQQGYKVALAGVGGVGRAVGHIGTIGVVLFPVRVLGRRVDRFGDALATGPTTVPAAAPAARPPATAPSPVPIGCEPGAPVSGSRLASRSVGVVLTVRGSLTMRFPSKWC